MKAFVGLLIAVLLGAGSYYVFVVMPGDEPDVQDPDPKLAVSDTGSNGGNATDVQNGDGELKADKIEKAVIAPDDMAKRQKLWALLRPARERLVPDPDKIGSCPPVDIGGRPNPVIQKYMDPINGFKVWKHDDGSYTYLHPMGGGNGEIDPKTGRPRLREMVTTLVPTDPLPIFPDELPQTSGTNGATNDQGQKK